jgi:hypothetical protein
MIQPFSLKPDLDIQSEVAAFFDEPTNTVTYVVKDPTAQT